MPKKPDRLIVNCSESTGDEFRRFAVVYDDHEDALLALLEAHKDDAEKTRRPGF